MVRPSLPAPETVPGSSSSTVRSSEIFFSPTSCSTTVATNVLVALPKRRKPSCGTGRPVTRSATPERAVTVPRGVSRRTATPVTPVSRSASASCCGDHAVPGGRGAAEAASGGSKDMARARTAAYRHER